MKKKLLSVALIASLVLSFAGCKKNDEEIRYIYITNSDGDGWWGIRRDYKEDDSNDTYSVDTYVEPIVTDLEYQFVVPPDSDFEYQYDAALDMVKIWDYLGREKMIKIPSEIDGDPVKYVELHNSSIEVVEYPDSITVIDGPYSGIMGEGNFNGCYNLRKIILPYGVKEIGNCAFYNCGMKEIEIPDSVRYIGYQAFNTCENLERITLPNSITSISGDEFSFCSSLKEINLPDSINKIEQDSFRYCKKLKSLTIPDGVTFIGDNLFEGSDALTVTYKGKKYNYSNWDDLYKAING